MHINRSDDEFSALLDRLEKRGGMYMQPFNYDTLVAYVSGFDRARGGDGESGELGAFGEWLDDRVGHHCSLHWSAVVKELFAGGDESRAIGTFFDLFREFAKDRKALSTLRTGNGPSSAVTS